MKIFRENMSWGSVKHKTDKVAIFNFTRLRYNRQHGVISIALSCILVVVYVALHYGNHFGFIFAKVLKFKCVEFSVSYHAKWYVACELMLQPF